ncbi:hypothetical protein IGI04_018545, partial [Brassica rapa subsp. trilocularis]
MPAEANNLPDSEAVPSSLPEVSPILRVAHKIHPTHPRIAYLCVLAALEESQIVCSLNPPIDAFKFKNSLWYWTKTNDETHGDGKVRPSDARDMQNFYLEYYEKNIQALFKFLEDNRYFEGYDPGPMPLWPTPTDGLQPSRTLSVRADRALLLTNACRAALALCKVVEHLSKDVQLPPQILEAHSEVKRLAQIFRPYNHIPNDPYSDDHPMRRLPAMRAVEAALGVKVYSRDNCVRNTTQPLPTPLEICQPKRRGHNKSEDILIGDKPVSNPGGI